MPAEEFVAGWISGAVGLIVGHPMDTVKGWQCSGFAGSRGSAPAPGWLQQPLSSSGAAPVQRHTVAPAPAAFTSSSSGATKNSAN
ncbi:S2545 protein, partial [Amia calva]|nr:S2545 protein [Amia calva]